MRADSWILNDLPEALVDDWYNLSIYNETDLQSAAYYWIRDYFKTARNESWIVRNEPKLPLAGGRIVKPDLVIYKESAPYDIIELKFYMDGFPESPAKEDLEKLRLIREHHDVRHAYQIVMYDDDDVWSLASKHDWMKNYLTFVGANVRRRIKGGPRRRGYESIRGQWEQWK